jgi:hypothetical protein
MPARESLKLIVKDDADVREVLTSFLTADAYAAEGVANRARKRWSTCARPPSCPG